MRFNMICCRSHTLVLRPLAIFSVLVIAILLFASRESWSEPICQSRLAQAVQLVTSNHPEASWGILAMADSKSQGQQPATIFEHQADKFLIPASNTKILTSIAALAKFGPEKTFPFRVFVGQQSQDSSSSTACLVPAGFPSLKYRDLKKLAQQLQDHGVHDVAIDLGHFWGEHSGAWSVPDRTWLVDDTITDEGPPPVATVINHNVITVSVQPGTARGDPLRAEIVPEGGDDVAPLWPFDNVRCSPGECETIAQDSSEMESVHLYRSVASGNELAIHGKLRVGSAARTFAVSLLSPERHVINVLQHYLQVSTSQSGTPPLAPAAAYPGFNTCNHKDTSQRWHQLTAITSAPLHQIMNNTMQWSNNLEADLWLKQVALTAEPHNREPTVQATGVSEVRSLLKRLTSVDPALFRQRDGSGVSRLNFLSPRAIAQVLYGVMRYTDSNFFALYRSMLPRAGRSGTLKDRFKDHPGLLLQAKTGTLPSVSALSGYVRNDAFLDGVVVFSIMVNNFEASQTDIRNAIDQIAALFASIDPRC